MEAQWKLDGTYFEVCDCEAACPCIMLGPPTAGVCTVVVAWHIDHGNFGDTSLDGLNVVLAIHSPGHMQQVKWKAALYIDEKAAPPQKEAVLQIFSGQAGGFFAVAATYIGEMLGAKSVPIDYQSDGKRRSLRIPNIVLAEVEAIAGAHHADVVVSNPPFTLVHSHPAVVARSKQAQFDDFGLKLDVSGKNSFYSPFSYQSA